MTHPVLRLDGLTLRAEGSTLLDGIDLAVAARGITALMGPVGTGKSSLLRWLCGTGRGGSVRGVAREAVYRGRALGPTNRPALLAQNTVRTVADVLAWLRAELADDPALICLDEPAARLGPEAARVVLMRLRAVARTRAVLLVSHNRDQVAALADDMVLLAGGQVQERGPAPAFFAGPATGVGRHFLRTGGAPMPRAGAEPRTLRPDLRGVPSGLVTGPAADLSGAVRWVVRDRIAVTVVENGPDSLREALGRLAALGVTAVLCADPVTGPLVGSGHDLVAEMGLVGIGCPAATTGPASLAATSRLCGRCQVLMESGTRLGVLMRRGDPGGGRMVACQLIQMGLSAERAAAVVQDLLGREPLATEDEQFLWNFELMGDLGPAPVPS